MRLIFLASLLILSSCTPESFYTVRPAGNFITKPAAYDLNVSNGARILYLEKSGGGVRSIQVENNQLQLDSHILDDFEDRLRIESYHFINGSTKTDRFYYISDTGVLKYTFDGLSSTEIFSNPYFNDLNSNFVVKDGLYIHEKLAVSGGQTGDAFYFSTKRNTVEKIVTRLGLIDGSMEINHSSVTDNFTSEFCVQNPASCSSTPYRWVSRILFLKDSNNAIGVASRLVSINGTYYTIPYYSFHINDSSVQVKAIQSSLSTTERVVISEILKMNNYNVTRFYRDEKQFVFNYKYAGLNKLFYFAIPHSNPELYKLAEFTGDRGDSFNNAHTWSVLNDEDDLSEWIRYPSLRMLTNEGERFYIYMNDTWISSPAINTFIPSVYAQLKIHKDKKDGWNLKILSSSERKIIWCDNDLLNCRELITAPVGDASVFLTERGAYALMDDELHEFQDGIIKRSYLITDSLSGSSMFQTLFYREGSFGVLRQTIGGTNFIMYLFDDSLNLKQQVETTVTDPADPEATPFLIAYYKILLGVYGSFFIPGQ